LFIYVFLFVNYLGYSNYSSQLSYIDSPLFSNATALQYDLFCPDLRDFRKSFSNIPLFLCASNLDFIAISGYLGSGCTIPTNIGSF